MKYFTRLLLFDGRIGRLSFAEDGFLLPTPPVVVCIRFPACSDRRSVDGPRGCSDDQHGRENRATYVAKVLLGSNSCRGGGFHHSRTFGSCRFAVDCRAVARGNLALAWSPLFVSHLAERTPTRKKAFAAARYKVCTLVEMNTRDVQRQTGKRVTNCPTSSFRVTTVFCMTSSMLLCLSAGSHEPRVAFACVHAR